MRTGMLLGFLFFTLLFIEQSFLHAFFGTVANIPLVVIVGMIIMQRVGIEEGIAWFIAVALFQSDFSALLIAMIGPMLILQIFTTRSVYALIGFGLTSYAFAAGVTLILSELSSRVFHYSITSSHPYIHALTEFLILIPGLFVGVILARSIERNIFTRVSFRRSS